MPTQEEVARGLKNSPNGSGKRRGSTNNANRLQAFKDRKGKGGADWGGCDPRWLQAVIVNITRLGGAVTFALSRDQGAYGVTLLLDDSRETLWFNGDADLDSELEEATAVLETMF